MSAALACLAVDFGTSNSAAAYLDRGEIRRIPLEEQADTIPTALFFNSESRATLYGNAANQALAEGQPGRYMRSLKSILGTSLMGEKRMLNGRMTSGYDVITNYLAHIKTRAEAVVPFQFQSVLAGRPVHFHSANPDRDARAEADLRQCYLSAGFEDVRFVAEPVAAAMAEQQTLRRGGLGLVVDIGGGTSDFALFRMADQIAGPAEINVLQAHGLRLGGTDFDRQMSLRFMMPFLGRNAEIRRPMGPGTITAPKAIFSDLSTWEKIPFLYNARTLRDVGELLYLAVEKPPFQRLRDVIENETGHDLAMLTEKAKIALNSTSRDSLEITLDLLERGLATEVSKAEFDALWVENGEKIEAAIGEILHRSALPASAITDVIEVGGGAQMAVIRKVLRQMFPTARQHVGATFTAIVDGLALAS